MTRPSRRGGWIEVITGAMFSGKSEELIRQLRRAQIAKQSVAIFKPNIDKRFGGNDIVSHNQQRIPSRPVDSPAQILAEAGAADVVGIDEAQFFSDEIVPIVKQLAQSGKRVVIAGLDKDYRGLPFGPMPQLMAEAEYITKALAICMQCGEPAGFTQRLTKDDQQILIGETDIYEARCRQCFEPSIIQSNPNVEGPK